MLLSLPHSPGQAPTLVATASTDILIVRDGWQVAIDATVSHQHRDTIERDAARLIDTLAETGAPRLDRALYESLFGGHFAVLALHSSTGRAFALRDVPGAKTLYLTVDATQVLVGTVQNEVAQRRAAPGTLSRRAAQTILVLDHFLDGDTLRADISEIAIGTALQFESARAPTLLRQFDLALATQENDDDQPTNVRRLREAILAAHARRAGPDNIVLLSGGIDSSVMLCALRELVEPARLRAVSCRVKGTTQDETSYAAQLAKATSVPMEIIEVDPDDEDNFASFEDDLLAMNVPYLGRYIYGNLGHSPDSVYFAGQDTRLHTPDLNNADRLAFALLPLQHNVATRSAARALTTAFSAIVPQPKNYNAAPRWRRGLSRAAMAPDLDRYLQRFLFHVDQARWRALGVDDASAQRFAASVEVESAAAKNKRHLYNLIVAAKWRTQYTDDMRYLQDVGRLNGTNVALPFYDIALARMSSGLPMAQATRYIEGQGTFDRKKTPVNKVLLREAFRAELPEALMLRAKAVSNTLHLLYSGVVGRKIRTILERDLQRGAQSVIRQLNAQPFVSRFLAMTEFAPDEEAFLTRIYWITAMAYIGRDLEVQ
ncbi:asparagine synthase-related protein [Stakelama pacifica]|uniref:asparagine synthase (glutamine-hydrolyzing) n=1 Tax=Stakelama pacifica TaxID=517720 RepID=A0A4R6FGK7_9SPHN|nr:asparagine synthase-related protein [Stakelama pacifica]TDN79554.1 asparagine synthase [Stakelama pacifica]GGP00285.1 hypothetical protein GCM10011329_35810 [Stakelama pacifica]